MKGRRALAGTAYEGKNPGGATVLMEFLDVVKVRITIGAESFDGFYFPQPNTIMVMVGREKVTWTVKGDTLESKTDGDAVTQLTKKAEGWDNDPAVGAALAGSKYTAQNPNGAQMELEFIDREKARLALGPRAGVDGTFRANADRVIVTVGGTAYLFTRDGDALETKLFGDKPTRFVKE